MAWTTRVFSPIGFIVCLSAFLAIGLLVFHSGFSGPMYYDSKQFLEFRKNVFEQDGPAAAMRTFPQRPVTMATFYANGYWCGMEASCFRLVNIFVLSATSVVVVFLVHLLLNIAGWEDRAPTETAAVSLFCGLLFLVHPLQTLVTLYIWQRAALLAYFFYFSSLLLYFASRSGWLPYASVGYICAAGLFLLAVFSKENAVTLPLMICLGERAFFKTSWKDILLRGTVLAVALALVLLLESFMQAPHGNPRLGTGVVQTITRYYQESNTSAKLVALTQSRMLFKYAAAILCPSASSLQLISPQVLSHGIVDPPTTLFAVIGVVAVFGLGCFLLTRSPLSGFGILFFMLNLLPEAALVPQFAFFGYRALLPMLGLLLVLSDCAIRILNWSAGKAFWNRALPIGAVAFAALVIFGNADASAGKAKSWNDPIVFWKNMVDLFPPEQQYLERAVRLHALLGLGIALTETNRFPEAIEHLREAVRIAPASPKARFQLGVVYAETGRFEEAVRELYKANYLRPGQAVIETALARALTEAVRTSGTERESASQDRSIP